MGNFPILTEFHIGERLRLDFYLPALGLAVEVQGTQHNEMNAFHHEDERAFKLSQQRDEAKAEMCAGEDVTLVCLPYKVVMASKSAPDLANTINQYAEIARKENAAARLQEKETDEW